MSSVRYINKIYRSDESGAGESAATQSARQAVQTFVAAAGIVKGDAVCADLSQAIPANAWQFCKKLDIGATNTSFFVGIAANAGGIGEKISVITAGLAPNANVTTGAPLGTYLIASGTGGRLLAMQEVTLTVNGAGALTVAGLAPVSQVVKVGNSPAAYPCAIAMELSAANEGDVWVLTQQSAL